jgi:hypothetical protein
MAEPEAAADTLDIARRSVTRGTFGARSLRPYIEGQIMAFCETVGLRVVESEYKETTPHSPLIVVAEADEPRLPCTG